MKAKRIIIRGKVHDVGYRLFLLTEAESMFIENFDARNIVVDGEQRLIALVDGPEEKINRFVEFARSNYPPDASVLAVEVEDYPEEIRSIDSFRQSFMVSQLAKIAQTGVGMLKRQDMMLEKQDMTLAKQDMTLEKQDETINAIREESEKTRAVVKGESEKTRETIEKVSEVVSEEGEKTREVIKERIEEDVEWLKAEIIEIKTTLGKLKVKVGMG
ncbi:MAG: acylphosphatase [Candidatus Syntrophoarchaeum sp.]|nr:acylphosphatase [Candidatus Syntrophoarchaeum sp.]